jgi:putative ABC transport system permease protein
MGFATPADAIGKQVKVERFPEEIGPLPVTIVGVVQDSRFRSIREPVEPMIFYDAASMEPDHPLRFVGRSGRAFARGSSGSGSGSSPTCRSRAISPTISSPSSIDRPGAGAKTFAGFALLAVVIACLGLFGLAAFTAERRTKEIGIRKVFGAGSFDIVRLLAWQFSKPVIVANLIAWPVAWWVMRDWLNGFDARIDRSGPGRS